MNNVLLVFLSLSVSGSILALILLTIRPFIRNKLSQTWQYYIWLIVIFRFLIPFTPEVSIVGELSQNIQNIANPSAAVSVETNPSGNVNDEYPILQEPPVQDAEVKTLAQPTYWRDILNNIWILWIGVALVLFVHKVASYRSFARFVRLGMNKISDTHILDIYRAVLASENAKRQLPLYENNQVVSPMLVGIVRPILVIPALETSDDELQNIFRHELTHYKRLDFLYKWLMQITLCLHWFNPFIYLINRQINKSCELSCDEAVIKHLDEDSRMTYGDALIASLKAQGNYSDFVVSMTMSENGNIVKERLDMIMNYKKKSKLLLCVTILLTILLLCGFTFAGAYNMPKLQNENASIPSNVVLNELGEVSSQPKDNKENSSIPDMADPYLNKSQPESTVNNQTALKTNDSDAKGTVVINLNSNGRKTLIHSSSFKAQAGQVLTLEIKSTISGTVDLFLFSPSKKEQRITIGGNNDIKTVKLSEGTWAYNCTGFFDSGTISIIGTISSDGIADKSKPSGSKDVDSAALHVMEYSRSWDIVEFLLPYMTKDGIDTIVSLNNKVNPNATKKAADYYNLTRPSHTETDNRAYTIMQNTGNWRYASPLFPYMSNNGINKVVSLYNQKTGKNVNASKYYNNENDYRPDPNAPEPDIYGGEAIELQG